MIPVPLYALAAHLLACQPGLPLPPPAEVELVATVAAQHVDEGQPVELTVQLLQAPGWTAELAPPTAAGLELRQVAEEGPVQVGERSLRTFRYELTGPPGSYVIEPGSADARGPGDQQRPLQAPPLFVDLGVQGPTSQVADFQAAPPPEPFPWALAAGLAAGTLALAGTGAWLWSRRRAPAAPPPPPDPPHVAARRQWAQVRAQGLADHPQAVALSQVLRRYLEAITGWPATMRTGPEILRWMEQESVTGASARLRAGRILDATDRLKFAREGGGASFFAALDQDFEAVIEATRPVSPAEEGP